MQLYFGMRSLLPRHHSCVCTDIPSQECDGLGYAYLSKKTVHAILLAGMLGIACNSSAVCTLTPACDRRTFSHVLRSAMHCHWLPLRMQAASINFTVCGRPERSAADKNKYNLQQRGAGAYLTLAAGSSLWPGCAGAKKAVVVRRPPNNCAARCHSIGGSARFATMKTSASSTADARTRPLAASASRWVWFHATSPRLAGLARRGARPPPLQPGSAPQTPWTKKERKNDCWLIR